MSVVLLQSPAERPETGAERFFQVLYGTHMRAVAKRTGSQLQPGQRDGNRQWVFLGTKERMKSVATLGTLFAVANDPETETPYYTPNGYYRRDQRLTEALRWLNGYVFDLDITGESVLDLFDRAARAGLPRPTAVIRTPRGYHMAYIFKEPVRATERAIRLYSAIMGHMAIDLGADPAAVGANRIFRTPTVDNLVYFNETSRYDFDLFKSWRELNHPFNPEGMGYFPVDTGELMRHPALQQLLYAPCLEGYREQTAFTLALAMKASGWPQERAEEALEEWYITCCAKGAAAGKELFTSRDVAYKVGYVYRRASLHAPSAEKIRELTGLAFRYRGRMHWEPAKPREERERSHLGEWEEDLLQLLKTEGELSGTQQELADRLSCPLTSFKVVLGRLRAAGRVAVETTRGRSGVTRVLWPQAPEAEAELEAAFLEAAAGEESITDVIFPDKPGGVVYVNFKTKRVELRSEAPPIKRPPRPPD